MYCFSEYDEYGEYDGDLEVLEDLEDLTEEFMNMQEEIEFNVLIRMRRSDR